MWKIGKLLKSELDLKFLSRHRDNNVILDNFIVKNKSQLKWLQEIHWAKSQCVNKRI